MEEDTRLCPVCYNITVEVPCRICVDNERDHSIVVVVEKPLDVGIMERTGSYEGVYHVLHGAISPINSIGPDDLKIPELVHRVDTGNIVEVILATNPGLEGDATAKYIKRELASKGVKVTWLARGIPPSDDLGFVDLYRR